MSNAPVGRLFDRGATARTAERPPCVSAGGRRSKPGERLGGQGRGRTADLPIFSITPSALTGPDRYAQVALECPEDSGQGI